MACACSTAAAQPALRVEGTEFVLTTAQGATLRSKELVGATLRIAAGGATLEVTIESVEDDLRSVGGRVLLHHLSVKDKSGRQVDLCAPDAEGRSRGFPVPDGRGKL